MFTVLGQERGRTMSQLNKATAASVHYSTADCWPSAQRTRYAADPVTMRHPSLMSPLVDGIAAYIARPKPHSQSASWPWA